MNLTPASLALFLALANDAGNWNGTPLLDISNKERGNLTDLKKNGLVKTFKDEGCDWVSFTAEGKTFAASNGVDLSWVHF
jgi:hypothetical protein